MFIVRVHLNVLEVLRIIDHIQHESALNVSEDSWSHKSKMTYMIVKKSH